MEQQITRRQLRIESLELRELMSVTSSELPQADFVPAETEFRVSDIQHSQAPPIALAAAEPTLTFAPPKTARPACTATPSTLTVYWSSPVGSSSLNAENIDHFRITVQNIKTKAAVFTGTADKTERSVFIENLDPKTRYTVSITSCGETENIIPRSTLNVNAVTADFPVISARKSAAGMNTATLILTDRDKAVPFVDGKTVKTYTVEITEKKTANWTTAQTVVIPAGTSVLDAKKGTISADIGNLLPNTDYLFRITASYTDGTKALTVTGKNTALKTAKSPVISIAKTYFSVIDKTDYQFAAGMDAKISSTKILGGTQTGLTVLVSAGSALDKTTKVLLGSVAVSSPADAVWNSKGLFTLPLISMNTIVAALGRSSVLGTKTLSFQLLVTFEFSNGSTVTEYSKPVKITLPVWY